MGVRQLSGLDAEFLAMESDAVCGHFGTVTLLEGARALDLSRLRAHIDSRLHRVPVLRQRLMGVVFGLDQPYWVDDADFDVARHVHEMSVPAPRGTRELADRIAELHAEHLDRALPLWQVYLFGDLADGRAAVYFKIHHAVMDGVGGSALIAAVFEDTEPDLSADSTDAAALPASLADQPVESGAELGADPDAPQWRPEPVPSHLDLISRSAWSITRTGLRSMRLGVQMMTRAPAVAQAVVRRLPATGSSDVATDAGVLPVRAPRTPFNAEITPARACVLSEFPLAEVDRIRRGGAAGGATVNDIVMALCAGALRRWLIEHEVLPAVPLLAAVPVSERTAAQSDSFGNRLALVRSPLPTQLADPLARLLAVREGMTTALQRHDNLTRGLVSDAAEYAPPVVAEAGWWLSSRVMRHVNAFNVMVANVRGPAGPLSLAGARVVGHHPVSVLVHGQGLNISVFGFADRLCWGLLADPHLVADLHHLADLLREELTVLRQATTT